MVHGTRSAARVILEEQEDGRLIVKSLKIIKEYTEYEPLINRGN